TVVKSEADKAFPAAAGVGIEHFPHRRATQPAPAQPAHLLLEPLRSHGDLVGVLLIRGNRVIHQDRWHAAVARRGTTCGIVVHRSCHASCPHRPFARRDTSRRLCPDSIWRLLFWGGFHYPIRRVAWALSSTDGVSAQMAATGGSEPATASFGWH